MPFHAQFHPVPANPITKTRLLIYPDHWMGWGNPPVRGSEYDSYHDCMELSPPNGSVVVSGNVLRGANRLRDVLLMTYSNALQILGHVARHDRMMSSVSLEIQSILPINPATLAYDPSWALHEYIELLPSYW